jgi:hypothetical protein
MRDDFPYLVDKDIFWENQESRRPLFEETAVARAFVDGELIAEVKRRVGDMQKF